MKCKCVLAPVLWTKMLLSDFNCLEEYKITNYIVFYPRESPTGGPMSSLMSPLRRHVIFLVYSSHQPKDTILHFSMRFLFIYWILQDWFRPFSVSFLCLWFGLLFVMNIKFSETNLHIRLVLWTSDGRSGARTQIHMWIVEGYTVQETLLIPTPFTCRPTLFRLQTN